MSGHTRIQWEGGPLRVGRACVGTCGAYRVEAFIPRGCALKRKTYVWSLRILPVSGGVAWLHTKGETSSQSAALKAVKETAAQFLARAEGRMP